MWCYKQLNHTTAHGLGEWIIHRRARFLDGYLAYTGELGTTTHNNKELHEHVLCFEILSCISFYKVRFLSELAHAPGSYEGSRKLSLTVTSTRLQACTHSKVAPMIFTVRTRTNSTVCEHEEKFTPFSSANSASLTEKTAL